MQKVKYMMIVETSAHSHILKSISYYDYISKRQPHSDIDRPDEFVWS